jgi:predicted protein tyrosine phosphatase
MKVRILSREQFIKDIIPNIDNFENTFFISILEPDDDIPYLHETSDKFKTWKFWDVEYDIASYKAFNLDQANEILDFILKNEGKDLIVHCYAGVSRSSAVGEFYWEMLGGSYKELNENFKNILPNGRVLTYLRMAAALKNSNVLDKINFA